MTLTLDLEATPAGVPADVGGAVLAGSAVRSLWKAQADRIGASGTPVEGAPRSAPEHAAPIASLAEVRKRRAIVRAARELFTVADYAAVDFAAVAQVAGVRARDISGSFGSRMELTLAALQLPPVVSTPRRAVAGGAEMVSRFLEFWETGDNAGILSNVLRAAMRDGRVRREVEDVLSSVLFVPLASGLGTTDAGPRARLVSSALIGLAVTRYVLREEPIASADHATLAAWMGPSIDCYLRGALGA